MRLIRYQSSEHHQFFLFDDHNSNLLMRFKNVFYILHLDIRSVFVDAVMSCPDVSGSYLLKVEMRMYGYGTMQFGTVRYGLVLYDKAR